MSKDLERINRELLKALLLAQEHLEYCGYGDTWEREVASAKRLRERIDKAISNAKNINENTSCCR
jgi:thioredoxin-related protein